MSRDLRADAEAIFRAGVAAVEPGKLVREAMGKLPAEVWDAIRRAPTLHVAGGGKACAAMAAGLEQSLGEELAKVVGAVNVPAGCRAGVSRITLNEARAAGSNLPTPEGVAFTRAMLAQFAAAGPNDVAICLISGGGSALLTCPAEGVSLEDKVELARRSQAAGEPIEVLNFGRAMKSAVKGGRLAAAFKGRLVLGLILSDVIGDPIEVVASGPTAPHPWVRSTASVHNVVVGGNRTALAAAAREAIRRGYELVNLGSHVGGDAEATARTVADIVKSVRLDGIPARPPACVLVGGEVTVELPPDPGRGGRNTSFTLATCLWLSIAKLGDLGRYCVLSGGTDGEDGPTDAAGAVADESIFAESPRLQSRGADALERCDSYTYFDEVGGLLKTGLTGTNVADIRLVLVV